MTPGTFCQKMCFLDILVVLRLHLGQISFNLVENAFQTQQLALLTTRIAFCDMACAEIKILDEKVTYVFRLFDFWIFFPFLFLLFFFFFATVIDLLLGLRPNLLRKRHRGGQFLQWSSRVCRQEILLWVFHSTFLAFLCISQAPLGWSLWSGYYWKDLFPLQKLSIDDANFDQKWWRQKWKKGQGSSRAVMAGT